MMVTTPADRPIVGVLGGMGPAATLDFYAKLIAATPARRDQDHLRVAMWADPTVPDRQAAMRGTGPSPQDTLSQGVEKLQATGATIIAAPCNTIHYWLESIVEEAGLTLINVISAAADAAVAVTSDGAEIGILVGDACLGMGLYQEAFGTRQRTVLVPGDQPAVMEAIYSIKVGNYTEATRQVQAAVDDLVDHGADAILVGCTDLSVIAARLGARVAIIDANVALAAAVVVAAGDAPGPNRSTGAS